MSRQEDLNIERFMAAASSSASTTSPARFYQNMREQANLVNELRSIRAEMRGKINEEPEVVEEPEKKEYLFDPKELDI